MAQHTGPGLGEARQQAGMPVVLIIGTAAEAEATARGLGFHAGWFVPSSPAGPTLAGRREFVGRPLPTVRAGNGVEGKEDVLAQNDGSKTPSPGGRSGAVSPLVLPSSSRPLLKRP